VSGVQLLADPAQCLSPASPGHASAIASSHKCTHVGSRLHTERVKAQSVCSDGVFQSMKRPDVAEESAFSAGVKFGLQRIPVVRKRAANMGSTSVNALRRPPRSCRLTGSLASWCRERHAGAGRVMSGIMACYTLAHWIKIVEMSSICHDYVVCSNSWQFRPWILSLLIAHSFSMRFTQI
jgi:hypothetical protein